MKVKKTAKLCPNCGEKGRSVTSTTLSSHLTDSAKTGLNSTEGFLFCANPACDVTYFGPRAFLTSDVRFPVFQKSADPQRLVCYCFNHSVAEIEEEILKTGTTTVLSSIRDSCKRGLDQCEKNNPQGSCCLGNVTRVIKRFESPGMATDAECDDGSCCKSTAKTK